MMRMTSLPTVGLVPVPVPQHRRDIRLYARRDDSVSKSEAV
jgi:hypothetical protein